MPADVRAAHRLLLPAALALAASGCAGATGGLGPSAAVPAQAEGVPATELPAGRNGIELLPLARVPGSVIDAMDRQTSVVVEGSLVRRLTSQDGRTTDETPLEFKVVGAERAFDAQVTFGDAEVVVSRAGDDVWVQGNEAYALAMGDPALVAGVCVGPQDRAFAPWVWLDGPQELLATLLGTAALGTPDIAGSGAQTTAVFPVGAGGPVVGSFTVAAAGEPLPVMIEVDDPSGRGAVTFADWSDAAVPTPLGCVEGASG